MNIIICDDQEIIVEEVKLKLIKFFREKSKAVNINSFFSAEEAMKEERVYAMAFLDIEMNDVNGFSLANWLKDFNENIFIFFITSHNDYLDDAFDIHAFRYLHKPIDSKRFHMGLEHALREYESMNITLDCECCDGTHILKIDEIIYLCIENRKVKIVTENETYMTKIKLDDWIKRLEGHNFSQPHRSYLVNLKCINSFEGDTVKLKKESKEESIYFSKRQKASFQKDFAKMVKKNYD